MGENIAHCFEGMTAAGALKRMSDAFATAGFETPAADARRLVSLGLGVTKADLIADPNKQISVDAARRLSAFLKRRLAHEPVSRIEGFRGFYGREFLVTPDTLDPRPDSETLIEAALETGRERQWASRPMRILDIGTGTGCLLLTLLAEWPQAVGLGTDISPAALSVATENAARLGLQDKVGWQQTRSLESVAGPFDLVISNPPYIPTEDIAQLDASVRLYDPRPALDGGHSGLDVYAEIASGLAGMVPDGAALFEVGAGQAGAVAAMLMAGPGCACARIRTWADLGGHTRCVALLTQ